MNKKFSTLLAAALLGTFTAYAAGPADGKLHQIKIGNGDEVLSVVKNKAKTADSLVVADAPNSSDIMKDAYKKSLWKFVEGSTDNTTAKVWTITNYATGSVLSLDLSKEGTSFVSGGQSKWLVSSNGEIQAIKGGETYSIQLQYLDEEGKVVGSAVEDGDTRVIVKKNENATKFTIATPDAVGAMTAGQINGLYGTSSVFDFDKDLDGNPIDGVAFRAAAAKGAEGEEIENYVTLRLNNGKYFVVDTAKWYNAVSDDEYWKLTTDVLPTKPAEADSKNSAVTANLLENGRAVELYAFKVKLDIASGYKMTIYPYAVPKYAPMDPKEDKAHKGMSYGITKNPEGTDGTARALVAGKFASSTEVLSATIVAEGEDNMVDATATFGEVEAPEALDADYTYYVQDYNKYDMEASESVGKLVKNTNYKRYYMLTCDGEQGYTKSSLAIPAYMWNLEENAVMANMMDAETQIGEGASIYLINEEEGLYAFDADTVKLTKGPKVADAQKMGYKVVTKADEVNGALSFRLVSQLADDLYMVSNKNVMYVANSELADAQKLKVVAAEAEGEDYETVGNDVVKPTYKVTDRLGKKFLTLSDDKFVLAENEEEALVVSFLATGKENQYKIVYVAGEGEEAEEKAITANAATGILEEDGLCATDRVIFEFATKEAPTYGAPAIGHVQITTLEDDNKMIANQKDGYAALKSVGQSILKSDEYTTDTLTMWLDTACVTFDETMPLYYISTKTFTPEAETRNFLINPRNFVKDYDQLDEYDQAEVADAEEKYVFEKGGFSGYYAAFNAASVCGVDSIAINGDTIDRVELNPAAIAFEVAAEVSDEAYRIVSKQKVRNYEFDPEAEEGEDNSNFFDEEESDLYLAQLNNVLFWTENQDEAEIFVINRASTPTANEGIEAESSVEVIAGNGTVTVQGAAGQTVTIATVLGKTVANEVVASDNATIAAPAGVVFVTVNGETTKVVVK
ncbi:DUF6383 domain-containing protein [Parabacteroides sp. ZJ-118]|uniref:DUF6383 domain-containing protein n=1 Tax=Parabacteroides sp. ZJ-118 TaxID=2709398 RepID=UPI0013EDFB18|nr:DUF6383 domain-containing protein [Parabacteroides sp. ZJ-118]